MITKYYKQRYQGVKNFTLMTRWNLHVIEQPLDHIEPNSRKLQFPVWRAFGQPSLISYHVVNQSDITKT